MRIKKTEFQSKEDKAVLDLCKEHSLSVSSVKYHGGHDGDGMNCNLKVGKKIVGSCYDDSWGGGFQIRDKSQTIKADGFNKSVQEIMAKSPFYQSTIPISKSDKGRSAVETEFKSFQYSYDMIVDLMVQAESIRKDCAKKILVKGTKIDSDNALVDSLLFNVPYNGTEQQKLKVATQMEKQGYITYEIINERL